MATSLVALLTMALAPIASGQILEETVDDTTQTVDDTVSSTESTLADAISSTESTLADTSETLDDTVDDTTDPLLGSSTTTTSTTTTSTTTSTTTTAPTVATTTIPTTTTTTTGPGAATDDYDLGGLIPGSDDPTDGDGGAATGSDPATDAGSRPAASLSVLEASMLDDPTSVELTSVNVVGAYQPADLSLYDRLLGWFTGSDSALLALLAGPLVALEVLVRALLSAGSGMVAPASLLGAYAFSLTWDRRTRLIGGNSAG